MDANRELIERFEKKIRDAVERMWEDEQAGWSGRVKHGNPAELFTNPFLRRYNIAVNFCADTTVEKMRKMVVTYNQISEDSKSATEN